MRDLAAVDSYPVGNSTSLLAHISLLPSEISEAHSRQLSYRHPQTCQLREAPCMVWRLLKDRHCSYNIMPVLLFPPMIKLIYLGYLMKTRHQHLIASSPNMVAFIPPVLLRFSQSLC